MDRTKRTLKQGLMAAAVLVGLAAGGSGSSHAAELSCAPPGDVEAFALRDLQSRLMVAGLACGQSAAYNTFAIQFKPELVAAGRRLLTYFHQPQTGGTTALDRHVTRAANAASILHSQDKRAYCAETKRLFAELASAGREGLSHLSQLAALPSVSKPTVCTAEAPATADASRSAIE